MAQQASPSVWENPLLPQGSLPGKYRSPDSAEAKIRELLDELDRMGIAKDNFLVLNNLQLALALEDYAPRNTETTYRLNFRLGSTLADVNPRFALYFLQKAVAINATFPVQDDSQLNAMGSIAGLHWTLSGPDSALHWYRLALQEAYLHHDHAGRASALNNLGMFYAQLAQYDSASAYYHQALQVLDAGKDPTFYCSIRDNIAEERLRQKDYAFALQVYQANDSIFVLYSRPGRIVLNRIKWMKVRREMTHADLRADLKQLEEYVGQHQSVLKEEVIITFYQFAKNYLFETGQIALAQHYDSLITARREDLDQQNKARNNMLVNAFLRVQAIRFQHDLQLSALETKSARQSLQNAQLLTGLIVLAGAAAVALLALFLRKRQRELEMTRRLAAAELRTKELEAQTLSQTLELKKKDVTTVALHNTQVLDNSRRVRERLLEIARQKEDMGKAIHTLAKELQTQEQLGERAKVIQENIDRINAGFYQALKARFPSLSKGEIELCGFLRVNLSNKDIALLKNIAPTSVKMAKIRLRKKLGVLEDLVEFIQGI